MPRAKRYGQLAEALLHYLVVGELLPADRAGAGQLDAFRLKHAWAARVEQPAVLDELRKLWTQYAEEIVSSTPAGAEPWIVAALRSPSTTRRRTNREFTIDKEESPAKKAVQARRTKQKKARAGAS